MNNNDKYIGSIFLVAAVGFAVYANFSYKHETLVCDRVQNSCIVNRTNLYGFESSEKSVSPDQIVDISYSEKQEMRGPKSKRMDYAKVRYYLDFYTKDGQFVKIFKESYLRREQVENAKNDLKAELAKTDRIIEFNRFNK